MLPTFTFCFRFFILSLFIFFCSSVDSQAQTDSTAKASTFSLKEGLTEKEYWEWGIKAGGGEQGYELGISRCNWRGFPLGMITLSALNEFPRGVTWVNPKLSAEVGWLFFAARISGLDYTNFNKHDIRFRPEYGFSLVGFINVMYHNDLFLSSQRFGIDRKGWNLTINFPFNPKHYTYF